MYLSAIKSGIVKLFDHFLFALSEITDNNIRKKTYINATVYNHVTPIGLYMVFKLHTHECMFKSFCITIPHTDWGSSEFVFKTCDTEQRQGL
jgi:hypothetical protein